MGVYFSHITRSQEVTFSGIHVSVHHWPLRWKLTLFFCSAIIGTWVLFSCLLLWNRMAVYLGIILEKKKNNSKKRKTGGIIFLVLKLSLFRSEDFSSHAANCPYFTAQNKCKYKKDWNGEFCFLDSSIDKVKDSEERGTEHRVSYLPDWPPGH